jgi:glycosyltransferase involved in cell wall biosynthesis
MKRCLFTDAPPLSGNAHGNHGVAKYLIGILGKDLGLILTRRFRRSIDTTNISEACSNVPLLIYPDVSGTGMRRFFPKLASFLDILLFALWFPLIACALKREQTLRIFVLCGADAWFLPKVWLLQMLGIPVEIYLVDDMEAAAVRGNGYLPPKVIFPLLHSVLGRCRKVYAISEGFAEHLANRFGCSVSWLPLPSLLEPPREAPPNSEQLDSGKIVFIGALNHLYTDAIRDVYEEICRHNSLKKEGKLFLEIVTYGDPGPFIASLQNQDWVTSHRNIPDEELRSILRNAKACLLPYSFDQAERLMVSTSFSCKILEYYAAGRPILVYGPPYASIPRYFREEGLPLCAVNKYELKTVLCDLESYQPGELLEMYRGVWNKYHSSIAIKYRIMS